MKHKISWILGLFFALFFIYWLESVRPFPEPDPEWIFLRPNWISAWLMQNTDWTLKDLKLPSNPEYPWGLLWPSLFFQLSGLSAYFLNSPWMMSVLAVLLLLPVPILYSRDAKESFLLTLFLISSPLTFLVLTDSHPHSFCAILFLLGWGLSRTRRHVLAFLPLLLACATKQLGLIYVFCYFLGGFWSLMVQVKGAWRVLFLCSLTMIASRFFYHQQKSSYLLDTFQHYSQGEGSSILGFVPFLALCWLSLALIMRCRFQKEWKQGCIVALAFGLSTFVLLWTSTVSPGQTSLVSASFWVAVWSFLLSYLLRDYKDLEGLEIWIVGSACLSIYLWMARENHNPYVQVWMIQFLIFVLAMRSRWGRIICLLTGLLQLFLVVFLFSGKLPMESMTTLHSALRQGPYHLLGSFHQDLRWSYREKVHQELSRLKLNPRENYYFLSIPEVDYLRYSFISPALEVEHLNLHPIQRDTDLWAQNSLGLELELLSFDGLFQDLNSNHKIAALFTRCSMEDSRPGIAWYENPSYFEEDLRNLFKGMLLYRMEEESMLDGYEEIRLSAKGQDYCLYLKNSLLDDSREESRIELWNRWKEQELSRMQTDQPEDMLEALRSAMRSDQSMKFWKKHFLKELQHQHMVYEKLESTDFETLSNEGCEWFEREWSQFPYHEPFRKYLHSPCVNNKNYREASQ